MVTAKDIHDGQIDYSSARRTSRDAFEKRLTDKSRPLIGDVLLTKDGSIGRVAICDRVDVCINQSVALLRCTPSMLPEFLKYLLESPYHQERMEADSGGSTIKHIYISRVDKMKVAVPSLMEQRAIAAMLCTLDRRRQLLRLKNETLESLARALFKSWFVDFDPVRTKVQGREPEGMDAATAGLFPGEFYDSVLGPSPKGWSIAAIGELIHRLPVGRKYDQKTASDHGSVPILDQSKSGIIGYHDSEPGVRASEESPVCTFANHTCHMRLMGESFSTIQNVLPFVGKCFDTFWIYYATKDKQSFVEYKGHWPDFVEKRIVAPNHELSHAFRSTIEPLVAQQWFNLRLGETLTNIRDSLLPRLISGKLRVPEAEKMVEAVL